MNDRVFIITGGGKGLGEAFATLLLEEDSNALVISISRTLAFWQQRYLPGGRLYHIQMDLSKDSDYEKLNKLLTIVDSDSVICFINNAATIKPLSRITDMDNEEVKASITVNVLSPVFIIKYLISNFPQSKIDFINISSGAAHKSIANWSIYSASKAFIYRFFETLKEEYKNNDKITFISVDPGLLDTGMQEEIRQSEFPTHSTFKKAKDSGKLQSPSEAAKRILRELKIL
jgi:benzil reductase ((S)-benzoin forming)